MKKFEEASKTHDSTSMIQLKIKKKRRYNEEEGKVYIFTYVRCTPYVCTQLPTSTVPLVFERSGSTSWRTVRGRRPHLSLPSTCLCYRRLGLRLLPCFIFLSRITRMPWNRPWKFQSPLPILDTDHIFSYQPDTVISLIWTKNEKIFINNQFTYTYVTIFIGSEIFLSILFYNTSFLQNQLCFESSPFIRSLDKQWIRSSRFKWTFLWAPFLQVIRFARTLSKFSCFILPRTSRTYEDEYSLKGEETVRLHEEHCKFPLCSVHPAITIWRWNTTANVYMPSSRKVTRTRKV